MMLETVLSDIKLGDESRRQTIVNALFHNQLYFPLDHGFKFRTILFGGSFGALRNWLPNWWKSWFFSWWKIFSDPTCSLNLEYNWNWKYIVVCVGVFYSVLNIDKKCRPFGHYFLGSFWEKTQWKNHLFSFWDLWIFLPKIQILH